MTDVTVTEETVTVVIDDDTERVVVSSEPASVVIVSDVGLQGPPGTPGEQGPPGPPGQDGSGLVSYHHDQLTPQDTWVIVHNLGYNPAGIVVQDSAGTEVIGDITYDTVNQLTIQFSGAFSGAADLS